MPGDAGSPTRSARAPASSHQLLLHESDAERIAQLSAWVLAGLRAGEMVLHLEVEGDPDGRLVRELVEHLERVGEHDGADLVKVAALGEQLTVVGLYGPGSGPGQELLRALTGTWPGVRMSSASCSAAKALGSAVYAEAERQLEQLCRHRQVTALCQLRRSDLTGPTMGLALALHPHRVADGQVCLEAGDHTVHIVGELDISNARLVHHVVDRWARHEATTLTLDLVDLDFVDLTAGRALLDACAPLIERDGAVLLQAPQHQVLRVLGMVGLGAAIEVRAA